MKILEVIYGYMIRKGISQKELARVTMMSQPLLSLKLKGKRRMSIDELRLIANALEITGEDLKRGLQ